MIFPSYSLADSGIHFGSGGMSSGGFGKLLDRGMLEGLGDEQNI